MLRLKITTNKTFILDEITSMTKLLNLGGRNIDMKYSDPGDSEPKFNYFELLINGVPKVLAVSGKVEQWEIPETETKVTEWEKPTKG